MLERRVSSLEAENRQLFNGLAQLSGIVSDLAGKTAESMEILSSAISGGM